MTSTATPPATQVVRDPSWTVNRIAASTATAIEGEVGDARP